MSGQLKLIAYIFDQICNHKINGIIKYRIKYFREGIFMKKVFLLRNHFEIYVLCNLWLIMKCLILCFKIFLNIFYNLCNMSKKYIDVVLASYFFIIKHIHYKTCCLCFKLFYIHKFIERRERPFLPVPCKYLSINFVCSK